MTVTLSRNPTKESDDAHRDSEAGDQRLRLREVGGREVGLDHPVRAGGGEQRGRVEVGGEVQFDGVGILWREDQRVVADECVGARRVLVEGPECRPCTCTPHTPFLMRR